MGAHKRKTSSHGTFLVQEKNITCATKRRFFYVGHTIIYFPL